MQKNPRKIVQNLIGKDGKELIIWHDVKNNSCEKSNFYCALSVIDLVNVRKSYQNRLRALVFCQRNQTPDIFLQLKDTNILVSSIERDFLSLRKQKDPDYLQTLKALHQSPDLKLKHLSLGLKHEIDLSQITAYSRPKRFSKRACKALNNQSLAAGN